MGPDELSPHVLQELAIEIAPIITHVFQKSVSSGLIPEHWRTANITPIFKKGDHASPSNYRPVSLTCVCSKLLEHIIVKHIMSHLEYHNILVDSQHGFRSRRSCETQLLTFVHELAKNMQGGGQTDIVLMDFSKAFDKVPHRRLLTKLHHYGIKGPILSWIDNFLTQRQQRVLVDGESSDFKPVLSGVPQGTVLGPLLFLMFINDLPECANSSVRLFADDAVLYRKINSTADCNILQSDLNNMSEWEDTWQMAFHPQKCKVLHITRARI